MKKLLFLVIILLFLPLIVAENLYQQDSLELWLEVQDQFELIPKSGSARVEEVTAELFLVPAAEARQEIVSLDTTGTAHSDHLTFIWRDGQTGTKRLGYTAIIKTNNNRNKVQEKVHFPLIDIEGYEEYTFPTTKIDSDNPAIIQKATELAEGEDDEFKVTFNIANWVAENVDYNLNELTTTTAQKASWVLEHREGVCDEMTSLFVAMLRSVGIPARFVSGISYTENEEVLRVVGKNWAPHGWAEVYFPDVGWVSFDITFDEYGYIDATHIKLREGLDPDDPGITFQIRSNNVDLETRPITIDAEIQQRGNFVPEEVALESDILAEETDFGSYNLVKGIIRNTADYYSATTLRLAIPTELEIVGENKRTILLHPKEVRETYWIIKVPENLDGQFLYHYPVLMYSEKNISVKKEFTAQQGSNHYSLAEIQVLTLQDEEKTYSAQVLSNCHYPAEIQLGETAQVECTVQNTGNTNLHGLSLCLEQKCKTVNLPIHQEESITTSIVGKKIGWNKLLLQIRNDVVEKKSVLQYKVLDKPEMDIALTAPARVQFGQPFSLRIELQKKSFVSPDLVTISVQGLGGQQQWQIEKLLQKQVIDVSFPGDSLAGMNKIEVTATWKDVAGKSYEKMEEIIILGEADTFLEKVKMFLNRILNTIR